MGCFSSLSLIIKWGGSAQHDFVIEPLKRALTNKVYKVQWSNHDHTFEWAAIVRVYGDRVHRLFDRAEEIRTLDGLSALKYKDLIYARTEEGRVEKFLFLTKPASAGDLRNPEILALLADELRRFHNLEMPGRKEVGLWKRLRKWVDEATNLVNSQGHIHEPAPELGVLEKEIDSLQEAISRDDQKIAFCHNDLDHTNILISSDRIDLIDFEYAAYNPIAYDIANLFCKMAADYDSDAPHELDYTKLLGLEERIKFLHRYMRIPGHGAEVDCAELAQLAADVDNYTLASHISGGLWGCISGYLYGNDRFNYAEYSRQRFGQYQWKKSLIKAPHEPTTDEMRLMFAILPIEFVEVNAANPKYTNTATPILEHRRWLDKAETSAQLFNLMLPWESVQMTIGRLETSQAADFQSILDQHQEALIKCGMSGGFLEEYVAMWRHLDFSVTEREVRDNKTAILAATAPTI